MAQRGMTVPEPKRPRGELVKKVVLEVIRGVDGVLYVYTSTDLREGQKPIKHVYRGGPFGLPVADQVSSWIKNLIQGAYTTERR